MSKRVLVVEDEQTIADLLTDLLEEEGYAVLAVRDGKKALAALAEDKQNPLVALILSDIMMPFMSGWELCYRLQSDPLYRHIPLILMSAVTPAMPANSNECKYSAFIQKPFDLDLLFQTVKELIGT